MPRCHCICHIDDTDTSELTKKRKQKSKGGDMKRVVQKKENLAYDVIKGVFGLSGGSIGTYAVFALVYRLLPLSEIGINDPGDWIRFSVSCFSGFANLVVFLLWTIISIDSKNSASSK
jgi:hypothetical protein